jgi:hypothetical protein
MQVFSGHENGRLKLGLLDMQGINHVPSGVSDLVSIEYSGEGELTLVEAVFANQAGEPVEVNFNSQAKVIPQAFTLDQNKPNPFNPETEISYSLPTGCDVRLDVYNITGQRVITLVDVYQEAGYHTVTWNSRDSHGKQVSSGIYFYRLTADNETQTRKMILMK